MQPREHAWEPAPAGSGGEYCPVCTKRRTPLTEASACGGFDELPTKADHLHRHIYEPLP